MLTFRKSACILLRKPQGLTNETSRKTEINFFVENEPLWFPFCTSRVTVLVCGWLELCSYLVECFYYNVSKEKMWIFFINSCLTVCDWFTDVRYNVKNVQSYFYEQLKWIIWLLYDIEMKYIYVVTYIWVLLFLFQFQISIQRNLCKPKEV